jgi:hypothetical protein
MASYNYLLRQTHTDKNNIQVGAVNLLIELEIRDGYNVLDISGATTKNIILEKPDDTVITVSGSFTTDGSDGLLFYKTREGDIDQAGIYNVQAYLVLPDFTGYSTPVNFTAYANLPLGNN